MPLPTAIEAKHHVSLPIVNVEGIRRDTLDGQEYLVAPVILLTEGVHSGSAGPMYYPPEVLAEFPAAWNGRPVPVLHPYNEDGTPISCNTPEVLERQSVGQLFNVVYEDGKLKGEVWVNISKARQISPDILEIIPNGQMEVSTGFQSNDLMMPGLWNEEEYMGVVQNIRPDHLALLPNSRGACSWEDGCGIRANEEESLPVDVTLAARDDKVVLHPKIKSQVEQLIANELSHGEIWDKLQKLADARDNDFFIHYIEEVFDTYVIMRVRTATGHMLIKMDYSIDGEENVSLTGEPTQVRKVVTYQPINPGTPQQIPGLQNQNTGGSEMAKKKENENKGACCKEAIDAMISNEASTYTEDDRKWLEEMPEDQLKRLSENLPTVNEEEEGAGEEESDGEEETAATENEEAEETSLTTLIANGSPEQKDLFSEMQAVYDDKKAGLIETITGNKANTFSKEDLGAKEMKELEGLAALAAAPEGEEKPRKDYSLNGTAAGLKIHTGEKPLVAASYLDKPAKDK